MLERKRGAIFDSLALEAAINDAVDRPRRSSISRKVINGDAWEKGMALMHTAEHVLRGRQARAAIFDVKGLFQDPAWDILLFLLIHERSGRQATLEQTVSASGVDSLTALQYLTLLAQNRLIGMPDPFEKRGREVVLTTKGRNALCKSLVAFKSIAFDRESEVIMWPGKI